jgi:ribonuclease HI
MYVHDTNEEFAEPMSSGLLRSYDLPNATNQSAELLAIILALRYVVSQDVQQTRVLTDSMYAINICKQWIAQWQKNGWMTRHNKPIKNMSIVREIAELLRRCSDAGLQVTFHHVPAHTHAPPRDDASFADWNGNNIADTLAKRAAYQVSG